MSADIFILASSNKSGIVYVDTMNLDGETNLKEKVAILDKFNENKIELYSGEMNCDMPNEILDFWEGQCIMEKVKSELMLANIKNLLLRGCFVRNTEYGIGVVLYTGMDSKIMRNLKKAPRKVSNVMKLMNKMLYTVFAFQIGLIIVFGGLSINWMKLNTSNSAYLNLVRLFNIIVI